MSALNITVNNFQSEVMESDKTLNAELDKLREEAYEELEAHEHEHEHEHHHGHEHDHHHAH